MCISFILYINLYNYEIGCRIIKDTNLKLVELAFQDHRNEINVQKKTKILMKMWHLKVLCYIHDTVSVLAWQKAFCINQKFTDNCSLFVLFFLSFLFFQLEILISSKEDIFLKS